MAKKPVEPDTMEQMLNKMRLREIAEREKRAKVKRKMEQALGTGYRKGDWRKGLGKKSGEGENE